MGFNSAFKGLIIQITDIIVKWAQEDVETLYNLLNNNNNNNNNNNTNYGKRNISGI